MTVLEDLTASSDRYAWQGAVDDQWDHSELKSRGRSIDVPPGYWPKKALYYGYAHRAAKGVWVNLFRALAQAGGPPVHILQFMTRS